MFLAGCGQTLSKPVFSVRKVRRKRRLNGEKTLGYRYETFPIDEDSVKKQIEEMVFDFMDEEDLDELILDNASCQDGLRGSLKKMAIVDPIWRSS
jgi:hypothetical protein